MTDNPSKRKQESPFDYIFEHAFLTAKHMSVWKLLLICVLASEAFTFAISAVVCYSWLGEFPLEILIVGVIDSFAVSLIVCAGLVFMLVRLRESDLALAMEKRRDEAILATITDAICILDPSYKVLYQNEAHKFLNGSNVGRVCYSAYRQRSQPCEMCPVEMALRDGGFHRVEKRVNTSAGLKYLDMAASPVYDESGNVTSVIEVIRDMTEHKRASSAAGVGEEMFRQVSERLGAPAWLSAGHGGRVIYVSPAFLGLCGRDAEDVYGKPEFLVRYAHEEDRGRVREALKASEQGDEASIGFRLVKPGGDVRDVHADIVPLIDEMGEVSRVVGVVRQAAKG